MKKRNESIQEIKIKLRRTELLLEINKKIADLHDLSQILWTLIEFI